MAAIFHLPKETLFGATGLMTTTGSVRFFDSTTTTPRAVFSDAGLTTPITQPIVVDSAGRLPVIYMTTGAYKLVVYSDAAGTVVVYTADILDSGIPAGSGALAVANGGTGANTAAGARTALGAASQTDQDTLATSVAAIEAQITAVGGTLGDLAGLDTVARSVLAAGFGIVTIQRAEVAASTALVTAAGTIPSDDTIPQIGEGTEVLTGSFTPVSATSALEIEVNAMVAGNSSDQDICVAVFQAAGANAIQARWASARIAGQSRTIHFKHRMASPGTAPVTFSVRIGAGAGTSYLNGGNAARIGGGSVRSNIYITEHQTF